MVPCVEKCLQFAGQMLGFKVIDEEQIFGIGILESRNFVLLIRK